MKRLQIHDPLNRQQKGGAVLSFLLTVFWGSTWAVAAPAPRASDPRAGGTVYLNCYNCHSLKPDVHLTGPSLSGLWNKPAGRVAGFESYSKSLRDAKIDWNEANLRRWLLQPKSVVPGTTMPHLEAVHEDNVDHLIDFLKVAMGPNGYQRVTKEKWLTEKFAIGQLQDDATRAKPTQLIREIQPCGHSVILKVGDGSRSIHWEVNLAYKTDSSPRGPAAGKPVLMKTGSLGDRFFVVFNSSQEFANFIKPRLEKCVFESTD